MRLTKKFIIEKIYFNSFKITFIADVDSANGSILKFIPGKDQILCGIDGNVILDAELEPLPDHLLPIEFIW